MNSPLLSLFQYKAWANTELHTTLSAFDTQQHPQAFHQILQTLDHANVVDRIFQAHLTGTTPAFNATASEPTPSLQTLQATVTATDAWYLHYVKTVSPETLQQRHHFTFTDGDHGTMTGEEMLLHVITHSGYHRGSVGQMLEDLGLASPPDSLTKYLHRHQPERRQHTTN